MMVIRLDRLRATAAMRLIYRLGRHDAAGLAAQLSYFFLLSLFPLLLFLVTLLPYLPISQADILSAIADYAPEDSLAFIERHLNELMNRDVKLLSLGVIGTLWSASNGLNAIVKAFNRAYGVRETRNYFFARGMSVLLTIAMVFVFIAALMVPVFGRQIGLFLFSLFGFSGEFLELWNDIRWLISLVLPLLVFIILYWLAPNIRLKCLSVFPGAVFSAFGWSAVSWGFSFYVAHYGNFTITYGSLGAIIVLMIWFYLLGMIIIIGGEINAMLSEGKKENC